MEDETDSLLIRIRKAYADAVNEHLLKVEQERYGYIKKFCQRISQTLEADLLSAAKSRETGAIYYVDEGARYDKDDMLLAVQKLAPGFNVKVSPNDDLGSGCVYISFDP